MVAHVVQNSSFYIQRNILIFRKNVLFINFLYSEKVFMFRENFLFRQIVDIQRKYVYSEKTTNLNFKLFEICCRISVDIFGINKES